MMVLSIIILSYNTKDLLKKCLQSAYQTIRSVEFEIIVVDNASKDGSLEMVKKDFPNVSTVQNESNVGFSRGANIGARNAKGKYILFLNSDIELLGDNFDKAVDFLERDETTAAIGGSLLHKNLSKQRSFGKFYNLINISVMLLGGDKLELLTSRVDKTSDVDWVSGGFFLIKNQVFNAVGGFDERFFMYMEDMELCFRLKKQGYTVMFYPHIKAIHTSHASSSRSFAITQIYKGLLYFYKKHKTLPEYFAVRLMLMSKAFVALTLGILTRNSYLTSTYRKALSV